MKKLIPGVSLLLILSSGLVRADQVVDLPNADFEKGLSGWSTNDNGMSSATAAAAHGGKAGLRVEDRDTNAGSSLYSTTQKAVPDRDYTLQFWARNLEGEGLAVYLIFYDENNQALSRSEFNNEIKVTLPRGAKDWKQYTLKAVAPKDSVRMKVWVHSFINNVVVAELDDFVLTESSSQ
jgi:oligo-alginate lyase